MSLKKTVLYFVSALCVLSASAKTPSKWSDEIQIPFTKKVLPNGLTVIVHEDHKAPIVAINIWYHVGSKNEKPGKTGFAHLFEHLMFNGSEHFDNDYFKALDKIGATSTNGSTGFDRTNYFQVVPKHAIDTVLWLESDRMGHLLGAITQEKLDEQRGVVQNEKRQRENEPYGKAYEIIAQQSFPSDHPYSWLPIGSMEDLNAASLKDVHEWFKTYYGAANAAISIAGDIETKDILQKVEHYFGGIGSGPPLAKPGQWIAKRNQSSRFVLQDRVPHARVYKAWNIPSLKSAESNTLNIFSDILANGKNSRLFKRLVYKDQIATDVSAFLYDGEISGVFYIVATAKPGQKLDHIETIVNEELTRLIQKGPTKEELERTKVSQYSSFVRNLEKVGSYSGKAELLIRGEIYFDDPAAYKKSLDEIQFLTVQDLKESSKRWLSDGDFTLEIHPYQEGQTKDTHVDRTKLPLKKPELKKDFPSFEEATLENGMKIVMMQRKSAPVVDISLIIDGGYTREEDAPLGTGRLAMSLLTEGTKKRSSLEFSRELEKLGASISASISLNSFSVRLSALKQFLKPSLKLYAETILEPAFSEQEFLRLKKQMFDRLAYEKNSVDGLAHRILPQVLFGKGHPYAIPMSGVGERETLESIKLDDVRAFHEKWVRPGAGTWVVVGDFDRKQILNELNKAFKSIKKETLSPIQVKTPPSPTETTIYLIDKKDASQSLVSVAQFAPPKTIEMEPSLIAFNLIFGGSFTSRINMNLRENKHWTYGARSGISSAKDVRVFSISSKVQMDKTKESMLEIQKEIQSILGKQPVKQDELEKAQITQTIGFSNSWETNGAMLEYLSTLINMNLDRSYYDTYLETVPNLTTQKVQKAGPLLLSPKAMTWLIVGDLDTIEKPIRSLKWGKIHVLNTEGQTIR